MDTQSAGSGGAEFRLPEEFRSPGEWTDDMGNRSLVTVEDAYETIPDSTKSELDPDGAVGYWLVEGRAYALVYPTNDDSEARYFVIEPPLPDMGRALVTQYSETIRSILDETPENSSDLAATILEAFEASLIDAELYEKRGESSDRRRHPRLNNAIRKKRFGDGDRTDTNGLDGGVRGELTTSLRNADEILSEFSDGIGGHPIREEVAPLSERQIGILSYYLLRDCYGWGDITPILLDAEVSQISVEGYNSNVRVNHSRGSLETNIRYTREALDETISRLFAPCQAVGGNMGVFRDGTQLSYMTSDGLSGQQAGFTISTQFTLVTPADLIRKGIADIEVMAYLWLAVENGRSILFAGTDSVNLNSILNALSYFGSADQVSVERSPTTRVPYNSWDREFISGPDSPGQFESELATVSGMSDKSLCIFPDLSTSQELNALAELLNEVDSIISSYTDAEPSEFLDDVLDSDGGEAICSDIDLLSIQQSSPGEGSEAHRISELIEVSQCTAAGVETNAVFNWDTESGTYNRSRETSVLGDVKSEQGWSNEELAKQVRGRQVILAHLIKNEVIDSSQIAGVIHGAQRDLDAILHLVATNSLHEHLDDLAGHEDIITQSTKWVISEDTQEGGADEILSQASSFLESCELEGFNVANTPLIESTDEDDQDDDAENGQPSSQSPPELDLDLDELGQESEADPEAETTETHDSAPPDTSPVSEGDNQDPTELFTAVDDMTDANDDDAPAETSDSEDDEETVEPPGVSLDLALDSLGEGDSSEDDGDEDTDDDVNSEPATETDGRSESENTEGPPPLDHVPEPDAIFGDQDEDSDTPAIEDEEMDVDQDDGEGEGDDEGNSETPDIFEEMQRPSTKQSEPESPIGQSSERPDTDSDVDQDAASEATPDMDVFLGEQNVDDTSGGGKPVEGEKYPIYESKEEIPIDPHGCYEIIEVEGGYQQCPFAVRDGNLCPRHN